MNPESFFGELKRRNVIRMAGLYLVGAWLVVQVAGTVLPMFGAPEWLPRTIVVLLAIRFVPAVIFSWVFELTPEGSKREEDVAPGRSITPQTGRRMDRMIIVVLVLALGYFAFDKFVLTPRREAALVASAVPNESRSVINAKSIAVLPFVNVSADKNDEYLSDGMTEELLNVLTKVKGLRVPGRSASFAFKGKTEDGIFRKVGEQLHVNAVLEGSVRKAGDKLRITAQLINAADGFHIWSETYDGNMKDILAMQSDVAQRVVQALQVQLGVDEARALTKKPTENPEAYRLYLLGRYHFAKFTRTGWTNAIQYFEQALQVDRNYTLALCGLADTYGWAGGQILPGKEAWAKEMELAQKARHLIRTSLKRISRWAQLSSTC
jgi:adenylate cyclase